MSYPNEMTDAMRGPDEELRLTIQRVARGIRNNRGDEVSDSQLSVLIDLELSGPLTPSELAATERVTPPSMNRTINGLETAGLVTRSKSSDDARKVIVELTPAGADLLDETRRLRTAWFSRRLETLTAEEHAALLAVTPILRKLTAP
jgi:DNA-binding MarR family transcriptional regulator